MYEMREVIIKNGPHERSVWVIDFDDPSMEIIGELLMTDAPMMGYSILDDINDVLDGEKTEAKVNGNRCSLNINEEHTIVEDLFVGLFDDFDTFETCVIDTRELRDLIVMWKERTED